MAQCHNGKDAHGAAKQLNPDVVLLDIGLPGIDGYQVARKIRSDAKLREATIIGLSGYGQDRDRELSQAAGFDDHLLKPVDYSQLLSLLEGVDTSGIAAGLGPSGASWNRIGSPKYQETQMQLRSLIHVGIALFLLAIGVWSVEAAEPSNAAPANDPVAADLEKLSNEYKQAASEWLRAIPPDGAEETDKEMSDEEWLRIGREQEAKFPGPDEQLLPRFLALANAHPKSQYGLDALAFVIRRGGPQTGDVLGEPWQLKERAIDAMKEHHWDDPRVVHVFDILSGSIPSRKTEAFLRQAYEQSPQPAVRAAAGLNLARSLSNTRKCTERSKQIKDKARLLNHAALLEAGSDPLPGEISL